MKSVFRLLLLCLSLCCANFASGQLIVAHRGASQDAPENTIAAFELAWEYGSDAIEADFYLTSDSQVACIHDPSTERVGKIKLPVAQTSLADLKQLDVGTWKGPQYAGERIPSLAEVVAVVPDAKTIYIEIKCGPEIVPAVKEELLKSDISPAQIVFISFKPEVIKALKTALPKYSALWIVDFQQDKKTGEWTPDCSEVLGTARRIGADGVDLNGNLEVVNQNFVRRCRNAGLGVHVWTIDDPEVARHFQRLNVASITTNRPRELRKVLFAKDAVSNSVAPPEPATRPPIIKQTASPAAAP
jgi:glycerophosphoryl diester phosphodiesterase